MPVYEGDSFTDGNRDKLSNDSRAAKKAFKDKHEMEANVATSLDRNTILVEIGCKKIKL